MKTITYNPETHVLVPIEPSEEMLQAALRANMQHVIDCINDPAKSKDIGSEETCKQTYRSRYASMIAAAPQPEAVDVEPVAMVDHHCECGINWYNGNDTKIKCGTELYTTPQPEPVESEPVAFVQADPDGHLMLTEITKTKDAQQLDAWDKQMGWNAVPLYTTPQPDRTAELEAALRVARDALNTCEWYSPGSCWVFDAEKVEEALAKINEVLNP